MSNGVFADEFSLYLDEHEYAYEQREQQQEHGGGSADSRSIYGEGGGNNTTDESSSFCSSEQTNYTKKNGKKKKYLKTKEYNSEACRKFRDKRKREREELIERNQQLEVEKELFLQKIAQLQTECESLRTEDVQDEKKENELLVAELRRYKRFIQNIVNVVEKTPTTTMEEKYRMLKTGVHSSIGQILGLCYTSAQNPFWKTAETVKIFENSPTIIRYAFLPYGSTAKTAQRINVRIDVLDGTHPNGGKGFVDLQKMLFFDALFKETLRNKVDLVKKEKKCRVTCEELLPDDLKEIRDSFSKNENERIQLYKYAEIHDDDPSKNSTNIYAAAHKEIDTVYYNSLKFDEDTRDDIPVGPSHGYVFMKGTSAVGNSNIVEMGEQQTTAQTSWVTGEVIRLHNQDRIDIHFVASLPVGLKSYIHGIDTTELIDDNGILRKDFREDLIMNFRFAFQYSGKGEIGDNLEVKSE